MSSDQDETTELLRPKGIWGWFGVKVHASHRLFKTRPMPLPEASTNTSGQSWGLDSDGVHKEIVEAFGVGKARMEGEGDQETSGGGDPTMCSSG
jgi:hypothetical protein